MKLDIKHLQTPDKTLALILGASRWPDAPDFTPSVAFANAAQRVQEYFTDCFKIPKDNVLWLFDERHSAQDMYKKISEFLKENVERVNQVITYCIGHGQVTTKGDGLYLPVRKTQQFLPEASSLNIEHLMETIKISAPQLKRFYILDCCFAGKALLYLQNNAMNVNRIENLLSEALRQAHRSENYAAIFASGPNTSAIRLPDESNTFFTEAFLQVVINTTQALSLLDVKERMKVCLDDLFKMYEKTYPDVALPPLPQIYESEVAQLPLFPSVVIQTDQLIIDVAKCLSETPYREIRLMYCDPPTKTVRVLCSRYQGDQDFHHIFQQIEKTTGWKVKVDVWEELAPLLARPLPAFPGEKEDAGLHRMNGQGFQRKTTNEQKLAEEESNRLVYDFKRTAERLVSRYGKSIQASRYQATQNLFQIIVPGVTDREKLQLKADFQEEHRGYTLGVAAHS